MKFKAYTLLELLIVSGIVLLLFTVSFYSLSQNYLDSKLEEYLSQLKSDIYQIENYNLNNLSSGIYFEKQKYTLFFGQSFDPLSSDNIVHPLPDKYTLSWSNIIGNTLSFEKITGYPANYAADLKITLTENSTRRSKSLIINKVGLVVEEE